MKTINKNISFCGVGKQFLGRIFFTLLALAGAVFGSGSAHAQIYNPGDISVINAIIDNNGLRWTKAEPADGAYVPTDWTGVVWWDDATGKRVTTLHIYAQFPKLTGVLDVSGLSNLQNLDCCFNQLTGLNVSGLSNLSILRCSFNQLTELNVLGLNNLQRLDCDSNELMELNVSGLSNLSILRCYSNQLRKLNVSGLDNLQTLCCYFNQLTELDVSRLSNLQDLYCQYNQLTELDLTGFDFLYSFIADNQTIPLTLTGNGNSYTANIRLNNPSDLVNGLSYANSMLTSNSSTITSSLFTVQTGLAGRELSGTLNLTYSTTGISELNTDRGAYRSGDRLHVFSPVAETIQIYSTSGVLLYSLEKAVGTANYPVDKWQSAVIIVRGSSGWVTKVAY